jgi:DNA ligase (NAD+)
MINTSDLEELERLGFGTNIDALEEYIESLEAAASMGEPVVTDATYDMMKRLLKRVKPSSEVFQRNWETDDFELDSNDEMLKRYGMASIQTVPSMEESELAWYFNNFASITNGQRTDLFASIKENGHGIRAIYRFGKLTGGSTRGARKKGRDITRHLKLRLNNFVEEWSSIPLLEVRGEAVVTLDTFHRKLAHLLKTPLSSVTSLIRDSASDQEIGLMNFVCYKILADDQYMYESLSQEYEALERNGFEVPTHIKVEGINQHNIDQAVYDILSYFENKKESGLLKYDSDGIVIGIDNNNLFYSGGKDGNVWRGNFALKAGLWESNIYCGIIDYIQYEYGKTFITPKAILLNGVVTANGATVTTVPLYNIGVMEKYNYLPNEKIFFKFGGETGVTCCTPYGERINTKE